MRPRLQIPRERLEVVLRRQGPLSAPALAGCLDVSVATVRRMLTEVEGELVAAGQARRRRYAWRRPLRNVMGPLPVFVVDREGQAHEAGSLSPRYPEGVHMSLDAATWPVPDEASDGWWEGLPYPLHDMRPQGFMGRLFARAHHHRLRLPEDPSHWSDEEVLIALSEAGGDTTGDLIVGQTAFDAWQSARRQGHRPLNGARVGPHYMALAHAAVAVGPAGSSAAGEFPKFTAVRTQTDAATPHVIVKFSGADGSSAVQRWADLLVCEHLALQALGQAWPGVRVARSRIVQHGGRTFLESERFDRHGEWGRSALVSVGTLDAALIGSGTNDWPLLARRLAAMQLLDQSEVACVDRLTWFGRLIGNTDMHAGNLSFVPHGRLSVAPAYDMLPMMYAPLAGGEVPDRRFEPALPQPSQRSAWLEACDAALDFWREVQRDGRIGASFKVVAKDHMRRLEEAAAVV